MTTRHRPAQKRSGVSVWTWKPASDDIEGLAKQLFKDYPDEHKALKITEPSKRVAIDYMRVRCYYNTAYKIAEPTTENNMFLKIRSDAGGN